MRRLVVVVPAIEGGFDEWGELIERLRSESVLADACWLLWDHAKRWYSLASPERLAVDLRARIDQECAARGPFEDIVLVGHSLGGLLVRQAYLLASGADHVAPQISPWAANVSRIILFAAINRGLDPSRAIRLSVGKWLARALPPVRRLLSAQIYRGSKFITNLRIQWIRHFAHLGKDAPVVVQLLGTKDELVGREDSVDVEQFPNAYYISVPEATHGDLYQLRHVSDSEGRYSLLRDAFVHARPVNAQNAQITGPAQVVFILHGIRANNKTWVKQIAEAIKARWPHVEVIGPQYKYFSALRFAIPMTRRKNLSWFQDAYSEALARNPRAQFSFIGHSNGTYLFGESLRAIPGMQFERAALVGSVLPVEYDWNERVQLQQIKSLRVDGSCYDWPVGWLCSALRAIGMRDVGTGGFEGFTAPTNPIKHEFFWYLGGHSAPLTAVNLPALAAFAVEGTVVAPTQLASEVAWFSLTSRALRVIAPLLALAALVAFVFLLLNNTLAAMAVACVILLVIVILDII